MKPAHVAVAHSALFKRRPSGGLIDELDFRLLDAVRKDPLAGPTRLGHAIGRSASAARRRLADLRRAGVLTGFLAVPAPQVLGLEATAATWDQSVPAEDLLAIPGTIMAGNVVAGGTLAGGYAGVAQDWLDAATAVVGEAPATTMPLHDYTGPVVGALDLRVMRAMVESPRASAEALARACGLSAKTVRRRRDQLVADRAIVVHPLVRVGASDAMVYHLHVRCVQDQVAEVAALLPGASISEDTQPIMCAFVRADSLDQQARTLAAIEALGVEKVEVIHEDEWEVDRGTIARLVDDAIVAWTRQT